MTTLRHHNSAIAGIGGAYSHAVIDGDYAFLSGQMAADAKHRPVRMGDIADETRAAMELLQGVLADLGLDFGDVVKVNIYMTDVSERPRINPRRVAFFGDHRPASTLVEVKALVDPRMKVEIEAHAYLG